MLTFSFSCSGCTSEKVQWPGDSGYAMIYATVRFLIEFVRDDPRGAFSD
jgi:prolipoprotein diacylglyceryltransferase